MALSANQWPSVNLKTNLSFFDGDPYDEFFQEIVAIQIALFLEFLH